MAVSTHGSCNFSMVPRIPTELCVDIFSGNRLLPIVVHMMRARVSNFLLRPFWDKYTAHCPR